MVGSRRCGILARKETFRDFPNPDPAKTSRIIRLTTDTTSRTACNEAGEPLFDAVGKPEGLDLIVQDNNENARDTRMLLETMAEGLALNEIIYDEAGEMVDYRIILANKAFHSVADFDSASPARNQATRLYGMSHEQIGRFWNEHRQRTTATVSEFVSPLSKRCYLVSTSPFHADRFVTTFFDISERKQASAEVQRVLEGKELVLRESHHRIKNNMSTIFSLLSIQSNLQGNEEAKAILQDAAGRLQAMIVLYDKLYRSADLASVPVGAYLPALIAEILGLFPQRERVRVSTRMDDVTVDASTLQLIGIIVYELMTNSMKHAFEGRGEGNISVEVVHAEDRVRLVYGDDGIGLPESVSFENPPGFGLKLIAMLAKQLHGSVSVERDAGTRFVVEFEA
jgi:two-component sensor histidine kinase